MIKRLNVAFAAALSLLAFTPAIAADNLPAKDANGTTFNYRALDLGGGVRLPMHGTADEAGAPIGASNGLYVRQGGAWSFGLSSPLPAGTNAIGTVGLAGALPAGVNTLGSVNVLGGNTTAVKIDGSAVTQPVSGNVAVSGAVGLSGSLPAGANALGTIGVTALPPLPVGTNAIGSVSVTALPVLPAGNNAIGTVGVSTLPPLPTGTNAIGSVGVSSLPALPAGANAIGSVAVSALPALPTGANTIGSVGLSGPLPAGTNAIGTVTVVGGSSVAVKVDGSAVTQPVSGTVAVTGVSTSALQTTGNTSLASIDTKMPALVGGRQPVDTVVSGAATNRGGLLTTAGTAQTLVPTDTARRGMVIQNRNAPAAAYNAATSVFMNCLTTATQDFNSLEIPAGALYETPPHHTGTGACSFVSGTANTPVYIRTF